MASARRRRTNRRTNARGDGSQRSARCPVAEAGGTARRQAGWSWTSGNSNRARCVNPLNPVQVSDLLEAAGQGSVVYLLGAGGCGMSGLGHLLLDLGHAVAGSDLSLNEEIRQLRPRRATIHLGQQAEQLRAARPVLMVYSSAIRANNPELQAARELNVQIVRRAFLLAGLVQRQCGICVAGMHGKTTTSALLSFALEQLQAQPSYAIGAPVLQLERHARFTPHSALRTPHFVVEADESDGTLREFRSEHAIVLNVDAEHLDHYASLEAVCREFRAFAENTRGLLVFCADDARLVELLAQRPAAISYDFHPLAAYRIETKAEPAPSGNRQPATRFEIWHNDQRLGEFTTSLLGDKNVSNCAAVIAVLHQLGFQPLDIAKGIALFRGTARRQQELFSDARFRLFDDYAHHPNELAAQLREEMPIHKERCFAALSAALPPTTVLRQNEPLAKKTTLRVGGPADVYVEPASESELGSILRICAEHKVPFVMLGRGSNLLIKDGGIRGVVICLAHPNFSRVEIIGERLHCGAGAKLKTVAVEAKRNGLTSLEFLEGIPGSVGGALRMNAGAMGSWMFDVVETIRFVDYKGQAHERKASEVNVEYRGRSLFKPHLALA